MAFTLRKDASPYARPVPGSFRRAPGTRQDLVVFGMLLAIGLLQIAFVSRSPEYPHDDVFYVDAARSLIHNHFYGVDGRAETNMPPGFSGLLAVMCLADVCGRVALLRLMAVLQTTAFLASYAFLRQLTSRRVAGAICVLLIASPIYFAASTGWLLAYFPYFLATMCALLVARRIEAIDEPPDDAGKSHLVWWTVVLACLCATSVLMASVGIALVGALLLRAAIVYAKDRRFRWRPAGAFVAAGAVGALVQLIWMWRSPPPLEWPIAGFPRPYLQQLLVKVGNEPELGMATFRDFVTRIFDNVLERSAFLDQLLLRHWVDARWAAAPVVIAATLIVVGWIDSVRRTRGEVHDWYFAGHEFIYLLWPWSLEPRFVLPTAPLACLYFWRGARRVATWSLNEPRRVGHALLPTSLAFTLGAIYSIRHSSVSGLPPGVQTSASLGIWIASAVLAAWLIRRRGSPSVSMVSKRRGQIALWVIILGLVALGLRGQLLLARETLDPQSEVNVPPADVEAAIWLRTHTDPRSVVMARQRPLMLHYSGRHVVWFPPSSDSRMLMDGIRRLGIDYIVVVHRSAPAYYRPPDDSSFSALAKAYPNAVCLVFETNRFRIFETDRGETRGPAGATH